eukprot:GHVT01075395.1.p3 GENE.GHVT01075395.1~~GHVT01075395.1.p3  ORF type:complete len:106 (-),score=6.41 GHVT01075395.1:1227-1544(-)
MVTRCCAPQQRNYISVAHGTETGGHSNKSIVRKKTKLAKPTLVTDFRCQVLTGVLSPELTTLEHNLAKAIRRDRQTFVYSRNCERRHGMHMMLPTNLQRAAANYY